MRKIILFMMTSVDGYFEGPDHDISWHNVDEDFNSFAQKQIHEMDLMMFGRRTYEMMAEYWPTEAAINDDPTIAKLMNETSKVVISSSLESTDWQNTKIINENVEDEIKKLKNQEGKNIIIFGSNELVVNLTRLGLMDEYRIMVAPVVIGSGTSLFEGLDQKVNLKLIKSEPFKNGNVLLCYEPIKE